MIHAQVQPRGQGCHGSVRKQPKPPTCDSRSCRQGRQPGAGRRRSRRGCKIKHVKNTKNMLHEWVGGVGKTARGEGQHTRHGRKPKVGDWRHGIGGTGLAARDWRCRSPHMRCIKRGEIVEYSSYSGSLQPRCLARPGRRKGDGNNERAPHNAAWCRDTPAAGQHGGAASACAIPHAGHWQQAEPTCDGGRKVPCHLVHRAHPHPAGAVHKAAHNDDVAHDFVERDPLVKVDQRPKEGPPACLPTAPSAKSGTASHGMHSTPWRKPDAPQLLTAARPSFCR